LTGDVGEYRSERQSSLLLQDLEKQAGLYELEWRGWRIWQLFRFQAAAFLRGSGQPGGSRSLGLGRALALALGDPWRLRNLRPCRVLAKSFCSALVGERNGRYRDLYFDDILDRVGPFCKIMGVNSVGHLDGMRASALPIHLTELSPVLWTAPLVWAGWPRDAGAVSRTLIGRLQGGPLGACFTAEQVRRRLRGFYWRWRCYVILLSRLGIRAALVADTGEYELNAAAKTLGIPVLELQHGVFTRHHPDVPPAWTAPLKNQLPTPTSLLVYGDYWAEDLRAGGFYDAELLPVGNPRLERQAAQAPRRDAQAPLQLLFTSQGLETERLAGFFRTFLEGARRHGMALRLTIKLHPVFEAEGSVFETALSSFPEAWVLPADRAPATLDLLAASDLHLSVSSACHYDALGLGVPTVILALPTSEVVEHLAAAGHAILASSPDELLEIARRGRPPRVSPSTQGYYCRQGALENILDALRAIGALP